MIVEIDVDTTPRAILFPHQSPSLSAVTYVPRATATDRSLMDVLSEGKLELTRTGSQQEGAGAPGGP